MFDSLNLYRLFFCSQKSLFDPALLNAYTACRNVSLLSPENVFDSLSVVEIYSRHNDLAKVKFIPL